MKPADRELVLRMVVVVVVWAGALAGRLVIGGPFFPLFAVEFAGLFVATIVAMARPL